MSLSGTSRTGEIAPAMFGRADALANQTVGYDTDKRESASRLRPPQ
jgi:hypothetical protein